MAAVVGVFLSCGTVQAAVPDLLIVPGKSIGSLRLPATEADVQRAFGDQAVPEELQEKEGWISRGTVLFPCDPARMATIRYSHSGDQPRTVDAVEISANGIPEKCAAHLHKPPDPLLRTQQPGDTFDNSERIMAERNQPLAEPDGIANEKAEQKIAAFGQIVAGSAWRLNNTVHTGTSLDELQRLNGRPFDYAGPEGDGLGGVLSWRGGLLETCHWGIVLDGSVAEEDVGREYHSDDPALRRDEPKVVEIDVASTGSMGYLRCLAAQQK